MKMSFSARLSWQTSIILAATMLVVFAYTWIRAQAVMRDLTERAVNQASGQIADRVSALFERAEQRSRFLAGLASPAATFTPHALNSQSFPELSAHMLELIAVSPEFSSFTIVVAETGEYVRAIRRSNGQVRLETVTLSPQQTLVKRSYVRFGGSVQQLGEIDFSQQPDLRTLEFYRLATEHGELVWTQTRQIQNADEPESPGVTCAVPIRDTNDALVGVAFVDLTLTNLSRYIQQMRIGEHGYAFLAELREGEAPRIIAHPDPNRLLVAAEGSLRLVTVEELGDRPVAEVMSRIQTTGGRGLARFSVGGREYLAGYSRVGQAGRPDWALGIVVSAQEFMGDLATDRNVLVMFAVIALMAGIYVSLLLAQRIAEPVKAIAAETEQIRALDLAPRPLPSTRIEELEQLGNAMEQLKTSLRSFEKLVPAQYARHLLATGQEAKLGGERRHVTIYFADIVGFTRLSEMMPPEELMEVLTEYLDVLSGKVIEHEGTVDKFNGDDVMAFWGAPSAVEHPALCACVSAARSQQALSEMHAEWRQKGRPLLTASFGIATGDVIVGNVGSRERMNYTVIGDAANLASRLQGLNKFYETSILIGEQTMVEAGAAIVTRLVDYCAVAGRERPAQVYELVGLAGEVSEDDLRMVRLHNDAMANYRARRFVEAADGFRTVIAVCDKDGPARILLKRCLEYIDEPPGEDWDGSHRAAEK